MVSWISVKFDPLNKWIIKIMPVIRSISLKYREYPKDEKLSPDIQELIDAAIQASHGAYAPYSGFKVGASVRLDSGRIISGSNVENAAFPSGNCAERTALSYAITNFPDDKPNSIAITATGNSGVPAQIVSPCGNCRQFISEEETRKGGKIKIILAWKDKTIIFESISDLLPMQFSKLSFM
jgi:cytidine deaminase